MYIKVIYRIQNNKYLKQYIYIYIYISYIVFLYLEFDCCEEAIVANALTLGESNSSSLRHWI